MRNQEIKAEKKMARGQAVNSMRTKFEAKEIAMKSRFAISIIFLGVLSAPLYAQTASWRIDSGHSDARLSINGTIDKTQQTIVLGAARVDGKLNLDNTDPTKSTFTFSIYPASSSSPAIDENGRLLNGGAPSVTNYTLISFHSDRVSPTGDGQLKVSGTLTVTHVEHQADLTPNEAYAGPVYAARLVQESSREESFFLTVPDSAVATAQHNAKAEASAFGNVNREDFPQLVKAILIADWPAVVENEHCDAPANIGEGYSGFGCSGTLVSVPPLPITYAGRGEDFPGPVNNAEFGNNLTIAIHMQLAEGVELFAQDR
jgi:polyisoprenoid-binding protein YceI